MSVAPTPQPSKREQEMHPCKDEVVSQASNNCIGQQKFIPEARLGMLLHQKYTQITPGAKTLRDRLHVHS